MNAVVFTDNVVGWLLSPLFVLYVLQLHELQPNPATVTNIQREHNRIIDFYWTANIAQLSQAKPTLGIFLSTPLGEAMIDTPGGFSAHGNHWIELRHATPTPVGFDLFSRVGGLVRFWDGRMIPLWHDFYRSSRRACQRATVWSKPIIALITLTWHSAIASQRIGCATEVPKQHGKSEAVASGTKSNERRRPLIL